MAQRIQNINKKLIENLNQENNTFTVYIKPFVGDFNAKHRLRNKNILKKLYNDTIIYKDKFREEHLTNNRLIMTKY